MVDPVELAADRAAADEVAVREAVESSQRAGWLRHDVEAYLDAFTDDATLVLGRGPDPGPRDTEWDRAHLEASRRMRMTGPPPAGLEVAFEDVVVELDGDAAVYRCRTISSQPALVETVGEIYRLRRTSAGWRITHNRAWLLAVDHGDERRVLGEEAWLALDEQAEIAAEAGDGLRATHLLLAGWRFREALEAARALAADEESGAWAHSLHGQVAILLGERAQAVAALRAANALDPSVAVPEWAR